MYGTCVVEWFAASLRIEGSTRSSQQVHGHDYRVRACVESDKLGAGFVVDHYVLASLLRSCILPLDHKMLNSVLDVPSVEGVSRYVLSCLARGLKQLGIGFTSILVETCVGPGLCGYYKSSRTD